MIYFIISSFLNALTSFLSCLFVLLTNPKAKTNQTFALYTFCVSIWAIFYLLWLTAESQGYALFYLRIMNISALFIPCAFFHFSCYLLNEYQKYKKVISILYIFNLIMSSTIGFTDLYILKVEKQLIFPYWPIAGKYFVILLLEYIFIITYSLFIIYKKMKTNTGTKNLQLKYLFYGILIAYIGGATNFPLCYKIPVLPFGNLFVSFYTIFITYAILKYQLMDIRIIVKKSLVYSTLIAILTVFYFSSIYLAERIFQGMFGYKSLLISVTLASLITLIFIPLKNIIQSFIEKFFFSGNFFQLAEQNEQLRREIVQSERLKSIAILASGMAHEIKNPLTVLKTFSEFLPRKMDDKEFLKKFQPMIAHEIDRIDDLVHELLDFAKPAPLQIKPTPIHPLLDQTLEVLSNDFLKHKINLHKDYGLETQAILNLDPNQFKQALLNILLNAVEAMPTGGAVTVTTRPSSDLQYALIKIQDTGCGIKNEDIAHIFDPFFTKKDRGTGLGLSITYEIIRGHQGKIFVESEENRGTAFVIELPL